MIILIDNGHGVETKGKRSPDGRLREYSWAREIAMRIVEGLNAVGYQAYRLVREENDVPLRERVEREHAYCRRYGAANVILISIHCNAASNGVWSSARGWSAYTSKGNTKSDRLAECLYDEAELNFEGMKIRKDMQDGDRDWEEDFYILKHTYCPAVLTENFFQDNRDDVDYLKSDAGKDAVVKTHIDGIIKYIESL